MISGWATIVAIAELIVFCCGVTVIFCILNSFFPPFKKIIDILVNADKD